MVSIHRFKTDQEAIDLANDTEYGLAAAVYGENIERATKVADGILAGTVCNDLGINAVFCSF